VGTYNVLLSGSSIALAGTSAGNYFTPTIFSLANNPQLTISKAGALTGEFSNPTQTKVYGTSDPSLASVGVDLTSGVINTSVYTWNNPSVAINDTTAGKLIPTFSSLA